MALVSHIYMWKPCQMSAWQLYISWHQDIINTQENLSMESTLNNLKCWRKERIISSYMTQRAWYLPAFKANSSSLIHFSPVWPSLIWYHSLISIATQPDFTLSLGWCTWLLSLLWVEPYPEHSSNWLITTKLVAICILYLYWNGLSGNNIQNDSSMIIT